MNQIFPADSHISCQADEVGLIGFGRFQDSIVESCLISKDFSSSTVEGTPHRSALFSTWASAWSQITPTTVPFTLPSMVASWIASALDPLPDAKSEFSSYSLKRPPVTTTSWFPSVISPTSYTGSWMDFRISFAFSAFSLFMIRSMPRPQL